MRTTHEVVDNNELLDHLKEDHGMSFLETGDPRDPTKAAVQHLRDLHLRAHTVRNGETENLHFDLLSCRWRYNNGRLAETTEDGPVRHRAPIDLTEAEQLETEYLVSSLLGPPDEQLWTGDDPLVQAMRADLGVESSDLGVRVIGSDLLSKFRRRISRTVGRD